MPHDNRGRGVLFPARERPTDRHPHYTGEFTGVDGKVYWLSGWRNTAQSGKKYISLALGGEKDVDPPKDHASDSADDLDDDIPF